MKQSEVKATAWGQDPGDDSYTCGVLPGSKAAATTRALRAHHNTGRQGGEPIAQDHTVSSCKGGARI